MALKRKRSSHLSSSPSSTTSNTSAASSTSNTSDSTFNLPQPFFQPRPHLIWPVRKHVNDSGRTMKRTRDNRPSETRVHDHTLELLWQGQRRPVLPTHQAENIGDAEMDEGMGDDMDGMEDFEQMELPRAPERGQQGLGCFWSLPAPALSERRRLDENGGGMDVDLDAKPERESGQMSLDGWVR